MQAYSMIKLSIE